MVEWLCGGDITETKGTFRVVFKQESYIPSKVQEYVPHFKHLLVPEITKTGIFLF